MATAHRPEKGIDRIELERRAADKAADPETRRWAEDVHSMLTAASADGRIKELIKHLESE